MVLQHPAGLSVELLEQFGAAMEKNGLYSVKLDVDELKALGGFLRVDGEEDASPAGSQDHDVAVRAFQDDGVISPGDVRRIEKMSREMRQA